MTGVESGPGPAVTVGIALAAGMLVQVLARHVNVPGIVFLLLAGALLGPDGAGLVDPGSLDAGLPLLVGFAVAVILFEGGLGLRFARIRREARIIRRLLVVGAFVTAVGGTLAARFVMGWKWRPAVLFGTLVIVTGPTVVTPLLRRIRLKARMATVVEAEAVLIDAIGAVVAVVALEVAISPSGGTFGRGVLNLAVRLGTGALLGGALGLLLAWALRSDRVVPDGLENVFTLAMVLGLFQVSNRLMPESGIMAVTAAGFVVGNLPTRIHHDLAEFKEQLTVMLIGMLFVLLAADVRLVDVRALGTRGALTVAILMLVVRPLAVRLSAIGSDLDRKELLFLSWLAPRGIVAAAVASLFAQTLKTQGIAGGAELQALVFLLIAVTVLLQGLSGGFVAGLLGLRRPARQGYAILGANDLALLVGRTLRDAGEEVVFFDSSAAACQTAEDAGFRVVFGNALDERVLERGQIDDRAAAIALTPNAEVNLLFAQRVNKMKVARIYMALPKGQASVRPDMAARLGAEVLFGEPRDIDLWAVRARRRLIEVDRWQPPARQGDDGAAWGMPHGLLLPMLAERDGRRFPLTGAVLPRKVEAVHVAILAERREEAYGWLTEHGYTLLAEPLDAGDEDVTPA